MNFLETFAPTVVMVMITAINLPVMAAYVSIALIVGRFFYAVGYCVGGPKGRIVGAIITDLGLITALVGSFISIFSWETSDTIAGSVILPISQTKFNELYPSAK